MPPIINLPSGYLGLLTYKRRKIGNSTHYTFDHTPSKFTTRSCTGLVDDWTDTMCSNNTPDKEAHSSCGDDKRLYCEQVPNCLNVRIDGR